MTTMHKLAILLSALSFFACKGPMQSLSGSAGEGAGNSSSGGTRVEYITDPSLNNMNAVAMTIPAKWHFQGVLIQGGKCAPTPFAVFRTSSPDGLSFVERTPALGWAWGTGPAAAHQPKDCLPLRGPMSAQDFLKYVASTMHLDYVGDVPVPAADLARLQRAQEEARGGNGGNSGSPIKQELARAAVRSKNGTFAMKGELRTNVVCSEMNWPAMRSGVRGVPDRAASTTHQCSAGVTYINAPENQIEGLTHDWDSQGMGGKADPAWLSAWLRRNKEQGDRMIAQIRERSDAQIAAQRQQFAHSQAVQQQMHEDFMATLQRGTDMSMARTEVSMNARSTAASDWVDYSLDQRTVMDPNTGQVNKVSSSYSYTWVDSSGRSSYQTNDPNADPNGAMQGSWTKQRVVHGDGTQ